MRRQTSKKIQIRQGDQGAIHVKEKRVIIFPRSQVDRPIKTAGKHRCREHDEADIKGPMDILWIFCSRFSQYITNGKEAKGSQSRLEGKISPVYICANKEIKILQVYQV